MGFTKSSTTKPRGICSDGRYYTAKTSKYLIGQHIELASKKLGLTYWLLDWMSQVTSRRVRALLYTFLFYNIGAQADKLVV